MRDCHVLAAVWLLARSRLCHAVAAAPADGPAKGRPLPPFAEVQQTVSRYFEARPDYRPGDLITREDVKPLLAELQKGASAARREADSGEGARQRRVPGRPIEHAERSAVHASDRRVPGRLRPGRSAQPPAARAADRPRPDSGSRRRQDDRVHDDHQGRARTGQDALRGPRTASEFQCADGPHLYRPAVVGSAAAEPCGGAESGRQEM